MCARARARKCINACLRARTRTCFCACVRARARTGGRAGARARTLARVHRRTAHAACELLRPLWLGVLVACCWQSADRKHHEEQRVITLQYRRPPRRPSLLAKAATACLLQPNLIGQTARIPQPGVRPTPSLTANGIIWLGASHQGRASRMPSLRSARPPTPDHQNALSQPRGRSKQFQSIFKNGEALFGTFQRFPALSMLFSSKVPGTAWGGPLSG
eukprot:2590209-Alexandrium_andersonii.AAC.1